MINFNTTSYHLLGASEVPGRMLLWVLCLWLKFNPHHRLWSDAPWAFCVEQETDSQQVVYGLDKNWTPPGLCFHSSLR